MAWSVNKKILLPLLTSALFSGSYVAGEYTTQDLGPLTVTLLRYLIALGFLALLLPRQGWVSLKVAPRDVAVFVLIGLSGIVGYHYFFFSSLRHTEVANTAIINALSPIVTGFAATLFLKERLALKNYLGIVIALVGVIVLLTRGDINVLATIAFNLGDLLMLLAVVCWAVYALLVKTQIGTYSAYTITFYGTLFGVVALLGLAPIENPLAQLKGISLTSLYAVIYMGVFASGIGYLLYTDSIRSIGATRTASVVYSLVPVFVAALAYLLFQETITLVMVFAAGLVLVGLHLLLATPAQET